MNVAGRFHLTYCTNIHPGETWQAVRDTLRTSLPRIRALLDVDDPMAVGLRLSAAAAESLDEPGALGDFREFLKAGRYYVPTINGFPYGAFHGQRVKERVYLPDWRDPARVAYTNPLRRRHQRDRGQHPAPRGASDGAARPDRRHDRSGH